MHQVLSALPNFFQKKPTVGLHDPDSCHECPQFVQSLGRSGYGHLLTHLLVADLRHRHPEGEESDAR